MEKIIVISTIVSAIATCVIACLTYQTKISQDKFQNQLSDLYKGIVLATLLSSNSDAGQISAFIGRFKQHYDGKTEIFKK